MATADLQRRTGGNSIILAGRQKKYGEHITGADVFNGIAPDWSDLDSPIAALRVGRYPFVRNTLDPTSETAESESIPGDNAAAPPIITSRSGGGDLEFEVLPGDAIHLLMGWFNAPVPTNTPEADKTIPSGKVDVTDIGTGTIVIDNDDGTALADWPGQLAIDVAGGTGAGTIQISGEQRRSRSNRFNGQTFETVRIDLDDGKKVTSKKFFHKIRTLTLSGFTTTPTGVTLTFKPDTHKASLTLPDITSLFAGWTLQMLKAALPFIAFDVIPNAFRLTVNQGSMRLVLTVLASYVQEGRTLQDPFDIAYHLPIENTENTPRKILDVYGYDTLDFYPSYGTAVAIGEPGDTLADLRTAVDGGTAHIIPITQLETSGTHNYGDPDGYTGDPVGGQPVTEDGQTRTVTVNATVVHETDTSSTSPNATAFWQDRYFEGQSVPIIVQHYNWNGIGRQSMIESEFAHCKLTEVPNLPIDGSGQVNRTLAFQAYPKGSHKEIKMNFYSKHGFKED